MEIPYEKTRILSTSELPGVICNPTLKFEFLGHPKLELFQEITRWSKAESNRSATVSLAAQLIKSVIVPGNESHELGTPGKINELIEQTDLDFVNNVLRGWLILITLERVVDVKKSRPSLAGLAANDGKNGQALE